MTSASRATLPARMQVNCRFVKIGLAQRQTGLHPLFMNTIPTSLLEPPGQSVLARTMLWVEDLAFGSIATAVAILTVAMVGVMLLTGRLDLRRGTTVILGCFILFGARSISLAFQADPVDPSVAMPATMIAGPVPSTVAVSPQAFTRTYDPYAGAATPQIR